MAQHLVLSTQSTHPPTLTQLKHGSLYLHLDFSDSPSANMSSSREPGSLARPPPKSGLTGTDSGAHRPALLVRGSRGYGRGFGNDAFELGVRVQTETHIDNSDGLGAQTVELSKVDSRSSTTGASGKGVPVQYDPERGDSHYDEDDTRHYDIDAKR